jgi:hypothetical protein
MTDLLDLLDTAIQGIRSSKTTEDHCGVPVVPNFQNRFGNNNPLKDKGVTAVRVVPSENNTPHPESGNSVATISPKSGSRAESLMFSLGKTGTMGTGAEILEKTVPVQLYGDGNNGNWHVGLYPNQNNGLAENSLLCCICSGPITEPVDTLWGADPAHRPCAQAAFQANKAAGLYRS